MESEAREEKSESVDAAQEEFGAAGAKEMRDLKDRVAEAKAEAERDPSKERELQIAEKRLELFVNEHDNAGAFKFKRFGREMVGLFEDPPDSLSVVEESPDGKFILALGAKDRRMLFVNMGELDRINKEGGGHAVGDAALEQTVKTIEDAITRQFGAKSAKYTMLRFRGNEFMVSFDSVSEQDFADITQAIMEAKPVVPGVGEPPPLVATGFEFGECVEIMNQLQAELGSDEKIDAKDQFAMAREFIDIMRKRADWSLDVLKFRSRVERVQEKVANGGEEGAKSFFENYMQKMFKGTPLEELSAFEGLTKSDAEQLAFEHASKGLATEAKAEGITSQIVATRLAEIRGRQGRDSVAAPSLYPDGDQKLAVVPERTRGQSVIDSLEARATVAEASSDPLDAEIARLDAQIESARRDRGTGLLERGSHYSDLEKAFAEGRDTALVFVDMGFLRYFDNKGGADVGNDALKVAADLMERAIEESGIEGRAYRYGGDEFTVQIDGGSEAVAKFRQKLDELRLDAGAIPAGKRGKVDGYLPTGLVFNTGVAYKEMTEGVFEALKNLDRWPPLDLTDPERVVNYKAELMTVIADKGVEEQKAVNRFLMLVDALRDETRDPEQVANLVTFSNKAIFAEAGGKAFLDALAESGKDEGAMEPEIRAWVAERSKEARKKEGGRAELFGQLIEIHGKIAYYTQALAESRHETDDQRHKYEKAHRELQQAKKERQDLIDARMIIER